MIYMNKLASTNYENWDLTQNVNLEHSRLYHLKPVGIESTFVESLSSYLTRLAQAHCLSVGTLYEREIKPVIGKITSFVNVSTINGNGVIASDYVKALEKLTYYKGLSSLTLLPWVNIFPRFALLKRRKAWCPECLTHWQQTQEVYEPLIWLIEPCMVCLQHKRCLEFICPHCKQEMTKVGDFAQVGHCSKCYSWLGTSCPNSELNNGFVSVEKLNQQLWITKAIGEFIALSSQDAALITRKAITDFIYSCINQLAEGNISKFALIIKVARQTVYSWLRGKALPTLSTLLSISYFANTSLVDGFRGKMIVKTNVSLPTFIPFIQSKLKNRPKAKVNLDELETLLQNMLNSFPPVSLNSASKQIKHSLPTAYKYCPNLCSAIKIRFAQYTKNLSASRKQQELLNIRSIAIDLNSKGIYPAMEKVRELMNYPGVVHTKEGNETLNDIHRELGWSKYGKRLTY